MADSAQQEIELFQLLLIGADKLGFSTCNFHYHGESKLYAIGVYDKSGACNFTISDPVLENLIRRTGAWLIDRAPRKDLFTQLSEIAGD